MNIFVTSECPIQSAKFLDDRRVIKMCAESVQMLATACRLKGVPQEKLPCKPTHANHPSNVWARSSRSNYLWLLDHTKALMNEKLARYPNRPPHVYQAQLAIFEDAACLFGDIGLTKFANCAANASLGISYKHIDDITMAYQLYLNDRWDTDKREPNWYGENR